MSGCNRCSDRLHRALTGRRALATALLAAALGVTGAAPAHLSQYVPGKLVEKATSIFDPGMHYAIYVPSAYTEERRWPVIVMLDPRGRALVPIERFRDAAERRGYILISSYESRSDVDYDPNTPALRAMVTDADTLFNIDRARIYLAGMSGTARNAWFHARYLGGSVAGIMSFAAGGSSLDAPEAGKPFAFFGAAGTSDFNFEELRAFATNLQLKQVPARFVAFEGGHQWAPAAVCAQAVDWMEIQAMRSGLKPPDAALVEEIYGAWLAEVDALGARAGGLEGFFAYRDIVVGFDGVRDVSETRSRAAGLAESPTVQAEMLQITELAEEHRAYLTRLRAALDSMREGGRLPELETLLIELDIEALRAAAMADTPTPRSLAARRKLEAVFVNTSFYEANAYLAENRTLQALLVLQVAGAVKPDDPRVLFRLAGVHARNGFRRAAAETLARAEALAAQRQPELLEDPFYFEPRSGEPLLAGVRR